MNKYILMVVTVLTVGSFLYASPALAKGTYRTPKTTVQRQADLETRLNALVTSGKITANQKKLIEDKLKELSMQKTQDNKKWKSLTINERKTLRQKEATELKSWEKSNGISATYLFGFAGKMKKGHV